MCIGGWHRERRRSGTIRIARDSYEIQRAFVPTRSKTQNGKPEQQQPTAAFVTTPSAWPTGSTMIASGGPVTGNKIRANSGGSSTMYVRSTYGKSAVARPPRDAIRNRQQPLWHVLVLVRFPPSPAKAAQRVRQC